MPSEVTSQNTFDKYREYFRTRLEAALESGAARGGRDTRAAEVADTSATAG
jgi:hypothetical protein